MKKFFLTTIASALVLLAHSQSYNKWYVQAGIGSHFGLQPTTASTAAVNVQSAQVGGRYMFNPYIGILLTTSYDFLDFKGLGSTNSNLLRSDLQALINVGALCNFQSKTSVFGLLYHTGFGSTHLWSKAYKRSSASDPLFKNSDDMFNVVSGITPQFNLGSRLTLFVDYSYAINFKQDMSYDFQTRLSGKGVGGNLHSITIGLNFILGKKYNYGNHIEYVR